MLKAEQIKSLSQNNQSVDVQKTKERIKALWGPLNAQTRTEILKLCGLTKFTIQRTYKVGAISAKLVGAMAQTLKINPYFLTGESDEQECDFTDDTLPEFLRSKNLTFKKGGKAKADKADKPVKATRATQTKAAKALPEKAVSGTRGRAKITPSGDFEKNTVNELARLSNELFAGLPGAKRDRIDKISEEELTVLLNSLVMRARFNSDSNNLLKLVKYILSC